MKRIINILLLLFCVSSCYDDSKVWETLRDHEARIARLEALCNQFNTNIESLQQIVAALEASDQIKEVLPVMENGRQIGYVITFSHRAPLTIYHGVNGQDGHTPIIGVKQDTDGFWYWTIDGEWVLDSIGHKVLANAAQASVPHLKIEEDYWWVSYDSGSTWTRLGKAIGENGAGDSMFESVTQDDKYVYFVLSNGQTITIPRTRGLSWEYV
ncbi:MAG: hypothetical protein IK113_05990 [Bacteroidales bacterium]|nr:hypothetical protein [Bacteroidales bacterium]